MLENIIRAKCRSGRKKLPIVQRVSNLRFIYLIERKNRWSTGEKPVARKVRTEWMKCSLNDDEKKYSLRMNQSVMCGNYLMVETFNWKIEGNKSGKKETANRGGCTTLKKLNLIARKNAAGVKLRSLKRWRDLLEWCGKFNWESGCHYHFKWRKHIKWKVGIMQEW